MDLKTLQSKLDSAIRTIPDFPKEGILFRDITTLINDAEVFGALMDFLEARYEKYDLDFIVGIEARGFIFGAALASRLKVGFVPIRKKGKLPSTSVVEKYALEYGFDEVEIHIDAFRGKKGARALLIDDLIATGGTAKAALNLIRAIDGKCVEACFLLRLREFSACEEIAASTDIFCLLDV